MSPYYMPRTELTPHLLCYFILVTPLHAWFHYSHSTEEETKVQSGIRLMVARTAGVVPGDHQHNNPSVHLSTLRKTNPMSEVLSVYVEHAA